jgi:UPF0755 protein
VNDDWTDPFSTDDPAAQEREQRRREREARRRAQLGQRAQEAGADEPPAPAEKPPAPPPAAKPEPPPSAEPQPPASEPEPEPSPPPDAHRRPPESEPTREHPGPPAREEPSFIDEPLPEDDWSAAGAADDWQRASEPRLPPLPAAGEPLPRTPRAKRTRRRRIIAAVAVFLLGLLVAFAVLLFQPFHGAGHGKVRVLIPKGSSASGIADILDGKGVVANSTLFRIRLDLSGKSDEIQAGKYALASDMSYGDAIDALTHRAKPVKPKTTTVTIPEGYDRTQTAALLKQDGLSGDYENESKSYKGFNPAKYGAKSPANLEGFLFPATYKLKPKEGAKDLVGQQLAAFTENIKHVKMGYARSKNLTTYDVVTIASILQREGGPKDFPEIAAVVYNRLHDGMPLQVDATIRFAEHNYTKPLTYSDLHLDSPYNSYTNDGLPPGPISNPGLAALKAAANPAHVPYLFYVTKPGACGRLLFATTYAQAQRQQARYNHARAAAGGKSPTSC